MNTNTCKQILFGLIALSTLWVAMPKANAATGDLYINGTTYPDLSVNHSDTGWAWNAATETLTISANISGQIGINCAGADSVHLITTGNLTINGSIYCNGSLSIDASDTLTVTGTTYAIETGNHLSFTGGSIHATGTNRALSSGSSQGDISISGTASLTAINGFSCRGSVFIATTGTVTVEGINNVLYIGKDVSISSGSLFVTATSPGGGISINAKGNISITGTANLTTVGCIYASDSSITIHTTGKVNVESSNYIGIYAGTDINIISDTINVLVGSNFALYALGTINVSGGTTTLTGTGTLINGILNHTGGTINGQGPPFIPTVVTGEVSSITFNSAVVSGSVSDNGGSAIVARKIMYRMEGDPNLYEKTATGTDSSFSANLSGLQSNSTYYVCAAAQNNEAWGYGEWKSFITDAAPAVMSVSVSPATVSVKKGNSQAFTATVTVVNGADEDVTWSLTGGSSASTSISASGLLTVAADETDTSLTVTATSVFDPSKKGTATVSVTGDVSTEELTVDNGQFTVYPNPTTGQLTIQWTVDNGQWTMKHIEILDMYGRNVKQFSILHSQFSIEDLSSGIYFIKIKTEEGEVVKKVVKK